MKEKQFLKSAVVILIFLSCLTGCTGGGAGSDADAPVTSDTYYKVGASIAAVPYKFSQPIKLYIKKGDGYRALSNGDYIPLGTCTFGVSAPLRQIDDVPVDQRVFISDGGYDDHVEANWDEDDNLYTAEFNFSDIYLTHPILVQVIYPDGIASKEKFVFLTDDTQKPASGVLVQNGLGIILGKKLLSSFDTLLEGMLEGILKMKTQVEDFSPADNKKASEQGVFHLNLKNLLDGDMVLTDMKRDIRGLNIEFENLSLLGENAFGQFMGSLLDPLLQFSLGSIGFDLAEMLSGLSGDDGGEEDMMTSLLGNLDIQQMLFINVFGEPQYTTADFSALGGGLFAYDKSAVELDEEGEYIWPDVLTDDTTDAIDLTRFTDSPDFNLGLALSQYNLNQMLSGIMSGFEALIDANALDLPFVTPEKPGDPMEIHITVNPAGIAIDLTDSEDAVALLSVNDLRLEFVEAGSPMAELSVDMTLELHTGIRLDEEGFFLDLSFSPLEALSHVHVMKDNKGLGIFDHARLVKTIFNALSDTEEDGPLVVSLNLEDFGLSPVTETSPGKIEFDGNGNCFMSLALTGVDPKALLGEDACFITTLSPF